MEQNIENQMEKNGGKSNLRTLALTSLFSILAVVGCHKCSGKQFLDEVPDNKVVEEKEKGNSVAFSCVFNFYRGGGADPGSYDFNGRINKRDGIYEGTMKLKDENSFSYELFSTFKANNKTELEEKILNKIRSSLPQTPSKDEWSRAEDLVKEACRKVE